MGDKKKQQTPPKQETRPPVDVPGVGCFGVLALALVFVAAWVGVS